jgi:hypothetical protein
MYRTKALRSEGDSVGDYGTAVAGVIGFAALLIGYFIGYRGGQVAGELKALKSSQHRNSRRHPRRQGTTSEDE